MGKNLEGARNLNRDVTRERAKPLMNSGGTAVLYGTLAPDDAVIKTVASDPLFWQHMGPAVVFQDYRDMQARIDSQELDVDEDSVLVLQNAGPQGGPGVPEWGMLPIPASSLSAAYATWCVSPMRA